MNKMRMRSPKVAVKKSVKGVKMKPLPAKKKKLSMSKEMEASISETISYVIKGKFSPIKAATDAKKSASLVKKQLKVQSDLSKNTTKKILPKKVEKILVKKKEPIKKEAAKAKIVERKVKAKKEVKKVEEPKVQVVKRQKSPAKPDNPETKQTKDKVVKEKKDVPEKKVKKAETKSKPKPKTEINKEVKTVKPKKKPPPKPKATLKVKKRPIKQIKPTRAKEKPKEIKKEIATPEDSANESPSSPPTPEPKKTKSIPKKRPLNSKELAKRKADQQRCRKMKLYNFWNGPKRHRVASLNAIAKVHCLYENESRSNILDQMEIKREQIIERKLTPSPPIKTEADSPPPTRTLRSVPGLRAVGKMWDMHDTTSSSEDYTDIEEEVEIKPVEVEVKKEEKKPPKKRRKKAEIIMDLKDMVVRKRMASLNATAILAASYSVEKRGIRGDDSDSETESDSSEHYSSDEAIPKKKCYDEDVKKEEIIEVRATPNKKVAVIVNQDTDVTITGVYVNSTTRSTHHEGFCSIAGMQYRISATSHTQTAATAVATETILQSASTSSQENANVESPPSKSYTPLDALTNMQPPAGSSTGGVPLSHHHLAPPHGEISPLSRRGHGCSTSAFSAPPGPCGPQGHHHLPPEHGYMPGYYQPAGPLISVPHGHSQPPVGKSVPLSEPSPSLTPPPPIHQPPPPSSAGDSSDSEVIITSVTTAKEASAQASSAQPSQQYRINHYPPSHTAYPYGYPQQYYTAPPPAPAYSHHDICYPPYHKYMYRRYPLPGPQYYSSTSPDLYNQPQNSTNQQVVTATSVSSASSYPPAPGGPPTLIETYPPHPPTLVETYPPPPPPPHYYPGYGPAPPACYNHASPSRPLNYINATYQSCPCPMQSCPKNVHTGPLAGDSKRSNISIAKESVPLPPVALALPLEPASATGPPSPARGSAGMPPPPSPAGATYQPPPPKQETPEPPDLKPVEKKRKARVGKAMVRNTMAANQNTMLLMCHAPLENVKREVESPKETEVKKIEDVVQEKIEEIVETKVVETEAVKIEEVEKSVDVLPCQKTVAENVKVKNMKRKLSVKESVKVEASPTKKIKSEKSNGSYKDFIKKTPGTIVKINNGKRKLITDCGRKLFPRHRFRKPTKRKLSPLKEESAKRLKSSKPLTASNLHNSKQNSKESKEKSFVDTELIENKEPTRKTKKTVNLKAPNKKIPPPVLDNIITKNNVDRTIESVISEICGRTSKNQEPPSAVIRTEKCKRETPAKKSTKTKTKPDPKNAKKTKCKEVPQIVKVPRRSIQLRWSNGWRWEGNPFEGKVFLNSDEATVNRTCYPAMRHEEGDIIEPRDCVLLKAGQRKNELPFVAKIAALWENPDDGEMMMSLLWYYRPEHTEQGRLPTDQPDEVFASRHKDSNSVACIEDKCYVLTFNEYCRYRKNLRRLEMGIEPSGPRIPLPEAYPRTCRQPPMTVPTSPDMVFFCRRVYDFRQKRIVKNPS